MLMEYANIEQAYIIGTALGFSISISFSAVVRQFFGEKNE
jgi:hypothetical protein